LFETDRKLTKLTCAAAASLSLQPSVEAAVAAHPERFVVADVKWTGGTEQMLDAVQQHFRQLNQQEQQQLDAVAAAPAECS
jgi:hypothetical protein